MIEILGIISALTPLLILLDYNKKHNIRKAIVFLIVFYLIWTPIMLFVLSLPLISVLLTLLFVSIVFVFIFIRKKRA